MKKLILFLLLAGTGWCSTVTITGNLTDAQGNPLNGTIRMQLPMMAQDITTNTQVTVSPVYYRVVNGAIQSGPPLYDVANLRPTGLYYITAVFDSAGNNVFNGNFVVTAPSPFNLGTATPTNVTTSNVSFANPVFTSATITGALTAKSYNNRQMCDQFAGADFSVKVNACIAAAIVSGANEADATGFSGTQTISQEIDVGNNANAPGIKLLIGPNITMQVSITDGVSCGIKLFNHSVLEADSMASSLAQIIPTSSSTNVDSLVCTDPSPIGGGSYIRMRGLMINNTAGVGTYANGLFHVQNTFDASLFEQIGVGQYKAGATGMVVAGTCCSTTFVGLVLFGNNASGPLLVVNSATTSTIGVTFINWSAGHAGSGQPVIQVNCSNTGNCAALNSIGLYLENNPNDTTTAQIQWVKGHSGFFQGTKWACTNAGANSEYLFDLAATSVLESFKIEDTVLTGTGNCTNVINDHFKGFTRSVPAFGVLGYYGWSDSHSFVTPVRFTDGNPTTPGISWLSENNSGFFRSVSNVFGAAIAGNTPYAWTTTVLQMASNFCLDWTNGVANNALNGSADNFLCRIGSGEVALGTTATGTNGRFDHGRDVYTEQAAPSAAGAGFDDCYGDSTLHALKCSYNNGTFFQIPQVITATSTAFATATTAGTCVQNVTAVTGATTAMAVSVSPVSTPGVGAQWSAFVSSAGNVTINECAVAASAGGTIAFNIRVFP